MLQQPYDTFRIVKSSGRVNIPGAQLAKLETKASSVPA
jgi:hypothetical protein